MFLSVPPKNAQNTSFKDQYSPQITLSDEYGMHYKYAAEDKKKGGIKNPKKYRRTERKKQSKN